MIFSKDIELIKFSESHFNEIIHQLSPIEFNNGYFFKRDDYFTLNGISGGKVRQCLKLVYDNLNDIHLNHDSTIITAAGLPSPQSVIVACVANYFDIKGVISVPYYSNDKVDYNRINVSLSQWFGSKVYGVGNPNTTGPEKDVTELCKRHGYFRVKFGMNGDNVTSTNSHQVQNIPDKLDSITVISGSGLSALSILRGIVKYKKNVKQINIIGLSNNFLKNKKLWYDTLPENEKYKGIINFVNSTIPYQTLYKFSDTMEYDLTYESKAMKWMVENVEPNGKNLFWNVGIRNYNISNVHPIIWHKSEYEQKLDDMRLKKYNTNEHIFW